MAHINFLTNKKSKLTVYYLWLINKNNKILKSLKIEKKNLNIKSFAKKL